MKNLFILAIPFILLFYSCNNKTKDNKIDDFQVSINQKTDYKFIEAPRWVDDSENIFTKENKDKINKLSSYLFEKHQFMFLIHTLSEYKPFDSFNDYIFALDEAWADPSNKYVIIVLSHSKMELRIINGLETEKLISSSFSENIINTVLIPKFRDGLYAEGIILALNEYDKYLDQIQN